MLDDDEATDGSTTAPRTAADVDSATAETVPAARRLRAVLRTQPGLRLLGPSDLPAMLELTACDPVVNVFADYRARLTQLDPRWLGGEVWGFHEDGRLVSACHAAANLVPVQATPDGAGRLRRAGRSAAAGACATIVGPAGRGRAAVAAPRAALGAAARDPLGPAAPGDRQRRRRSPPDPLVRRTDAGRPRRALPGVRGDVHRGGRRLPGGRRRRRPLPRPGRAAGQPRAGRSPASRTAGWCSRPRSPRASPYACQVQGVYVDPRPPRRGAGRRRDGRRRASWRCARSRRWSRSTSTSTTCPPAAAYARAGFEQTGTFATIMF